jgi:monoamine oxidase
MITGWAPFHWADQLSGSDEALVFSSACERLRSLLRMGERKIEDLVESASWHDWQNDPFSRGAYSYVKVGGDSAQADLAAPLENRLFFAGEATDVSGYHGTVHGAMASAQRAANEIHTLVRK